MQDMTGNIKFIFSHMGDILSQQIYGNRLLYSLTEDAHWLEEIMKLVPEGLELFQSLASSANEKFIFGAGRAGKSLKKCYPSIHWAGFVDNYVASGTEVDELPVISLEELCRNHPKASIVISAYRFHEEIYRQLLSMNIPASHICDAGKMILDLFDKQYFDLQELPKESNEVFVDAGVLNGQNTINFYRWSESDSSNAVLFEPDHNCISDIERNLHGYKYELIPKGLWDKETVVSFQVDYGASKVIENETLPMEGGIRVVPLDQAMRDRRVTFIKMDIEGAEWRALKGAENIIRQQKPKIAISVYHKKEDIWEIPALLLTYFPHYKFYLRHYYIGEWETVLYAIP